MNSRDWCDIGYNFLIDKYGQIFEGRAGGIDKPVRGAHAGNGPVNEETMGVSLMGTFTSTSPTSAMKSATADLIAWRFSDYGIKAKGTYSLGGKTLNRIAGHRNVVSTECPGAKVYAWLSASGGLRDTRRGPASPVAAAVVAATTPSRPPRRACRLTGKTATSLTFAWDAVDDAAYYWVALSTSSSMSNAVKLKSVGLNEKFSDLKPGTKYYAQVRTTGTNGLGSSYSSAVSATTESAAARPGTSPTGLKSTSQTSSSLTFAWNKVSGAKYYWIALSTSSSMSNPVKQQSTGLDEKFTGLKRRHEVLRVRCGPR